MMSFKEWQLIKNQMSNKSLNESFGGNFTLGLKSTPSVGITGSKMAEMGLHPGHHPDNEDPDMDDDSAMGGGDDGGLGSHGLPDLSDMDLDFLNDGGDDDDGDNADDDNPFGGEDTDDDDAGPDDDSDDLDNDDDDDGDEDDHPKFMSSEMPMEPDMKYMHKGGKCKCCSMEHEMNDFFTNLSNQLKGNHNQKNSPGINEDLLLPGPEDKQPGPGEVGFAPQGRLNNLG